MSEFEPEPKVHTVMEALSESTPDDSPVDKQTERDLGPNFAHVRHQRPRVEHRYRLTWTAPHNMARPDSSKGESYLAALAAELASTTTRIERMACQFGYCRALNWDGSTYQAVFWPDHEKDVAELSRALPGWDFELSILPGEVDTLLNWGDMALLRKAFRNGQVFDQVDTVLQWSSPRSPQPWEPDDVTA